jgi:hypothetical protein
VDKLIKSRYTILRNSPRNINLKQERILIMSTKTAKKRQLTEAQIAETNRKEMENFLKGKPVHCQSRDQRLDPKVCENVQKTAGCSELDCQFYDTSLAAKATGKPKSKSSKPRKASYQTLMRAVFDDKGFATLDELVKVTGADAKNTSVGVSILRNPKRVKFPMKIAYHRPSKTYFNLDHTIGASEYIKAEESHELQKRADAKAKREAKRPKRPKRLKHPRQKRLPPRRQPPRKRPPRKLPKRPQPRNNWPTGAGEFIPSAPPSSWVY